MSQDTQSPLLELKNLNITFESSTGTVDAVRDVNLTIYPGQSIAIVGESGSGKSTTAMSILGLLPGSGKVKSGEILFEGKNLADLNDREMVEYRGSQIGLVPQDPMSNLNPVWKVGTQIEESLEANHVVPKVEMPERVVSLLEEAGLPDAAVQAKKYPHQLSGGMRQRALIAMGLSARPKLLIADEPTSALDVTVQKRILDHLGILTDDLGIAVLFITHDLGLAAERANHLVVMHRGRVVEAGPSMQVLNNPQHPYTQRLVNAAPSLTSDRIVPTNRAEEQVVVEKIPEDIIRVENLTKVFPIRDAKGKKSDAKVVDDVSFNMKKGCTTALVGESGSGKSTVANMILNLLPITSGAVYYEDTDMATLSKKELFAMRRKMQVVFQNPYGSLDPQYSIYRCIEEPLVVHKMGNRKEREKRVAELLDMVAMPRSTMRRFPNELSGGQRQRIAVARALALNPEVIVLDEAVSALDVLVQNQVLQLLTDLQAELDLSYLFITHDLAVVRQTADDVVVMQKGKIVEQGPTEQIFAHPAQEYTRDLIDSVPAFGLKVTG